MSDANDHDALISAIPPTAPVLIAGPTASGKSALALEIAQRQGGTVVNADASQVYDCWRVLSARPSPGEEARAPHALYGHVTPTQAYSAGHWLREVAGLLDSGARPIITGGTGLYFMALTEGLAEIPATPPEVRAEADALSLETLLAGLDPATAAGIDRRNPARVQRAWEVLRATGRGLADWQADTPPPLLPLAEAFAISVNIDKARLDDRIARRFDAMLAAGALAEVAALVPPYDPALPAHRAIGAAELAAHLGGRMTLDAARAAAIVATRQYAKRQRTWARRRMADWHQIKSI
jgi:tRNA dimethylallyltransferase